ncbi:MAG: hypothetical protein AB8B83_08735 [Bdellovibrionales bacterium]
MPRIFTFQNGGLANVATDAGVHDTSKGVAAVEGDQVTMHDAPASDAVISVAPEIAPVVDI